MDSICTDTYLNLQKKEDLFTIRLRHIEGFHVINVTGSITNATNFFMYPSLRSVKCWHMLNWYEYTQAHKDTRIYYSLVRTLTGRFPQPPNQHAFKAWAKYINIIDA